MPRFLIVHFFFAACLLAARYEAIGAPARRVVRYETEIAAVTGRLERQTFAGPPNYESIADGDQIERGWYVRLNEPVDVVAQSPDPVNGTKTEENVKIMQLVTTTTEQKKFLTETSSGAMLRIRGSLMHAITGHHHSRVLVVVNSAQLAQ